MDHSFILSNKLRDYFNDKVKLSFVTERQVLIVTKDDKVYEFERDSENGSLITFGFNNSIIESKILMELCDKNVVDFAHGDQYCIAFTRYGQIYCWGKNESGQLGNGSQIDEIKPILNEYLIDKQIVNICCGKEHTLALSSDGNIYAWGLNGDGQIGMCNDHHYQLIPFRLDSFNERIKANSCGFLHSMALTESGNVYGWGDNQDGKLGCKKSERFKSPKLIIVNTTIDKISCGFEHSILLSKDGELYVLGYKNWTTKCTWNKQNRKIYCDRITSRTWCFVTNILALTKHNRVYRWLYNNNIDELDGGQWQ